MSFRRFVLVPAVEIAAKMIHPIIGWPIERLLLHLNEAKDELVVMSPSAALRAKVADAAAKQFDAQSIDRPQFSIAAQHWPREYSTWLVVNTSVCESASSSAHAGDLPYAAAAFPKLTILLDAEQDAPGRAKAEWSRIVRQPGRGPTLRLQTVGWPEVQSEVFSAIESVWPALGPKTANRLE
jgi:hypothetical protein